MTSRSSHPSRATQPTWSNDLLLVILAILAGVPSIIAELASDHDDRFRAMLFTGTAIVCGVVGLAMARRPRMIVARKTAALALVMALTLFVSFETFRLNQVPVLALAHFAIGLTSAKFLEMITLRDRIVIVVISMLSLVIGAMISANVVFGAILALFLTAGVYWLISFRMRAAREEAWRQQIAMLGPHARSAPQPPEMPHTATLSRSTITCTVVLVLAIITGFLTVPRNLFGNDFPLTFTPSIAGFTSRVRLNDSGAIFSDDQPVMRVQFELNDRIVGGKNQEFLLRGATMTHYVNGVWMPNQAELRDNIRLRDRASPVVLPPFASINTRDMLQTRVWIDSMDEDDPFLFTVFPVAAAASPNLGMIQLHNNDRALAVRRVPSGQFEYTLWSPVTLTQTDLDLLAQSEIPEYFRLTGRNPTPPFDPARFDLPRVQILAEQITGFTAGSVPPDRIQEAAVAINNYLVGGTFTYTLSPRRGVEYREPIYQFLFETRGGYCSHFATAMTLMCQSLGIDARLVAGYRTGEYHELGQYFRVRKKDAHAWVEVKIPGQSWTAYDPTPASTDADTNSFAWLASLRRFYDYVQFQWASIIVSYDVQHRAALFAVIREWWSGIFESKGQKLSILQSVRELVYGPESFEWHHRVLYWFCELLVSVLLIFVLRALWIVSQIVSERFTRLRHRRARRPRRADARFYDSLLVILSRQGIVKPRHLTPREFARDLVARRPDLAGVGQLTEWFYLTQFGSTPLGRLRHTHISDALESLRLSGHLGPIREK